MEASTANTIIKKSKQIQMYKVGTKVSKEFDDPKDGIMKPFSGEIKSYDEELELYKVQYEDGDSEDMSGKEVSAILVKGGNGKKKASSKSNNNKSHSSSKKRDRDDLVEFEYTGCESVPTDVTHVNFHPSVIKVGGYAIDYNNDYDGLAEIENEYAFKECHKLVEVVLNEGLTKIGRFAFTGCNIKSITFPSTLEEIDICAFQNCDRLEEAVLNDGLETIEEMVFRYCGSLLSITIPSSVTDIERHAFSNCQKMKEVVFNEGLRKVGDYAFGSCKSLHSITLPSTLSVLGVGAFGSCSNLKDVVLNEGIKKIGEGAFSLCTSLQCITCPSSLIEIGKCAFERCYDGLKEFEVNEGIQKIGKAAFHDCISLKRVVIPSTLIEIGAKAFYHCNKLKEVELNGIVQKIGEDAFGACPLLEKFTFPRLSNSLENIIQVGHWSEVVDKIDDVRGLVERRGSKICVSTVAMEGSNWLQYKNRLQKIVCLIAYYEKKEATSLFELALWKFKINQTESSDIGREACRVEVPGPVRDTILHYLCPDEQILI